MADGTVAYGPGQLPSPVLPAVTTPIGSMLAGNADRERAVDVLRAGFTEGRLTQEEFTERVQRAYASRTYGELGGLTADLPAGPLPVLAAGQRSMTMTERLPGDVGTRSFAGLVVTAIVMFTFAALFTAIAVYMHTHSGAAIPSGPVHLLPFVQHHRLG